MLCLSKFHYEKKEAWHLTLESRCACALIACTRGFAIFQHVIFAASRSTSTPAFEVPRVIMATADLENAPKRQKFQHGDQSDYIFVHSPPDYFQTECPACLVVLRSPHLTSCCGHNFCKECIESVQRDGKSCPLCSKEGFTLVYNRAHDVSLKQLEVYCTHRESGCEWRGTLDVLGGHLNVLPKRESQLQGCAFAEVQCRHNGCEQSVPRHLITSHQTSKCPQRPFNCEHRLEYESTYHDVTTNHWPECKNYPVSCPNGCTPNTMQRHSLVSHLEDECPLQEVECEFGHAGCKSKLPRKDMPDHLSNSMEMVHHMSLLAKENHRLRQQNQELTAQLSQRVDGLTMQLSQQNQRLSAQLSVQHSQLSQQERELTLHKQSITAKLTELHRIAPIKIVFSNFSQHKSSKDRWISESFYTHPHGYKMALGVYANGKGEGEGTHVGCSVYLRRGEFDNCLEWPFRGDVIIQLLNQRRASGHHTESIDFTDRDCAERVQSVLRERAHRGLGHHMFICHNELGYSAATNCQYLMNNCLHFKVRVKLNSL